MEVRAVKFVVWPVIAASLLSACTSTGSNRGGLFAKAPPNNFIVALQGGIVSRAGTQLSESDRQRALEAEYRALEFSEVGQATEWKGRNISGEVVAAAPYQVGSQNCRSYTHTLTINERELKARGTACRNADGAWTPLS
ncbi:hypothetical protein MUU53_06690 [Rhizobium lemnae]|uniref:Surface antigen domain-containing protein n=1 Tax=Rhizobium lemnae TaxID=1214924 RepID=A0ABV8E399_9HYPH|nr:hypothetical protein [Rhizobium lemnae]MCJ8507600.1 hypothetical protein [Rhizobium lemnae]